MRTRTAASELACGGYVRLNGGRIDAASQPVRSGDVITVALDRTVRILKVKGFAERRGSAEDARPLYDDLSPPPAPVEPPPAIRDAGAGRPTKRDRRAIDRLTGGLGGDGEP